MKKYMAAVLVSISMLGALTGCRNSADIGKDEAAKIALEDAGYAEADVIRLLVSKDRDDGRSYYEVEFTAGNKEYDYEIQSSDGQILSVDMEITGQNGTQAQDARQDNNSQNNQNVSPSDTGNVKITQEEAIELALERVPGAAEQDVRIELDYDDGRYKYEGDIIYNQKEYDFEIDAETGTFLEWSEERR